MLERKPQLAQSYEASTMHKAFHVALKNIYSQGVKRHAVLKPLRLVHTSEGCLAGPCDILPGLLIISQLGFAQQGRLLPRIAAHDTHLKKIL